MRVCCVCVVFFKQKTAYEMRISDWSSDVCSSDLSYKRKGGRVYVEVRENGEVSFHEGFVTAKEAKRLSGGGSGEGDALVEKPSRPEVSGQIGRASCRERVCQYL